MSPVFLAMVGIGLVLPGGTPTGNPTTQETLITIAVTIAPTSIVYAGTSTVFYSDSLSRQNMKNLLFKYKQQNNTAIQSALRLGGGMVVHDMGKILGLDTTQTKCLGRYLRANRKSLSKMTDTQFAHALYVFAASLSTP